MTTGLTATTATRSPAGLASKKERAFQPCVQFLAAVKNTDMADTDSELGGGSYMPNHAKSQARTWAVRASSAVPYIPTGRAPNIYYSFSRISQNKAVLTEHPEYRLDMLMEARLYFADKRLLGASGGAVAG